MSLLPMYKHKNKQLMMAVASISSCCLFSMLCSCAGNTSMTTGVQQILTASTSCSRSTSLFVKPSLWRQILREISGKEGLEKSGPQIQSAGTLLLGFQCLQQSIQEIGIGIPLTTWAKCGRALALGLYSKQNLTKLFSCSALKQTGRVSRKKTKGKKLFHLT